MKDVMMNVLTKLFNKTEDELNELIFEGEGEEIKVKDNAADALIELDAARVKRIKDDATADTTKKFDDGYKKATKEVLSKFESDFREKTGFESDLTGIDLITAWGETLGKTKNIDNIKTHPEFLKIEKQWQQEKQAEIEKVTNEFNDYKNNVQRNQTLGKIKDMAETEFLKLNPVLSSDPAKKKAQTEMFLERFNHYDYDFDEDSTPVIKKEGNRLEDGHGNRISFGNFVKEEANKLFDFQKQQDRESPGNNNDAASGVSKTTLSREEYNQKVNEANGDPARLNEIGKKYTRAD